MKLLKKITLIFVSLLIICSVIYFNGHYTNGQIVRNVAEYLRTDSSNIKKMYYSTNELVTDSCPEIDFFYKAGESKIWARSKMGCRESFTIPNDYNLPFFQETADDILLEKDKYMRIELIFSNYQQKDAALIYTTDSKFVQSKYKNLPLIQAGNLIQSGACLYQFSDSWFLVIR
jgi:hypothetical protein